MAECCDGGIKIIYACSGQSNVGEIADRVVRKLRNEGFAKMACLAGVGADLSGYVQTAKASEVCFTVDGCPTACARKNMERIGVSSKAYVLTEMGLKKGETPVTDEVVERIAAKIRIGLPLSKEVQTSMDGFGCGGK